MKRVPWRDILFLFGAATAVFGVSLWSARAAVVSAGLVVCVLVVWVSR